MIKHEINNFIFVYLPLTFFQVVIFEVKHLLEKICSFENRARGDAKEITTLFPRKRGESVENIDRIFSHVRRLAAALNHTELCVKVQRHWATIMGNNCSNIWVDREAIFTSCH